MFKLIGMIEMSAKMQYNVKHSYLKYNEYNSKYSSLIQRT